MLVEHGGMRAIRIAGFLVVASFGVSILPVTPAAADTVFAPIAWNGKRVYLSPAHHVPDNVGCDGYRENAGARSIAIAAASVLQALQYEVRVGSGTFMQNIDRSNAWNADIHIPIHSNSGPADCVAPYVSSRGGTWFMYAKPAGYTLASSLRRWQAIVPEGESPGTSDKICTDFECATVPLAEIRSTDAASAYIEVAFHTYRPDVDYLRGRRVVIGLWIALGVDEYLGHPRIG